MALLVIDLMAVAYLVLLRYGMTGWADAYDSADPPDAPREALRGMWLLVGGAVATGGGLFVLGWRIPSVVQMVVLGVGAGLLACLAARGQRESARPPQREWLNHGIPPAQVAEWAGCSGVPVLPATYARCVEGRLPDLKRRLEAAGDPPEAGRRGLRLLAGSFDTYATRPPAKTR